MFFLELATWAVVSLALVGIHIYLSPRPHPRPGLTVMTALMWGVTGGLLGTVIRLRDWDTGRFSVVALVLAGVATASFLLLEWGAGHQPPEPGRR
jgi:hypothetical protein